MYIGNLLLLLLMASASGRISYEYFSEMSLGACFSAYFTLLVLHWRPTVGASLPRQMADLITIYKYLIWKFILGEVFFFFFSVGCFFIVLIVCLFCLFCFAFSFSYFFNQESVKDPLTCDGGITCLERLWDFRS